MANWQPDSALNDGFASNQQILAEESARAFMAKVYRWMFAGLAVTAATAFFVARSDALLSAVLPIRNVLFFAQIGVVLAFSFLAHKVSGAVAATLFLAYSLLTGLTFSVLFLVYTQGSVAGAFGAAGAMFGAMSLYGTITKKDLSSWSSFLFMGLIGIVIAGLVNIFLASSAVSFVISCAAVVIFTGLTAYDTQKLRQYHAASGYSSSTSLAVSGALTLYLDFINLFIALLRLFGRRR